MLAGFLWAFMLFGFSSFFFKPQFQYTALQGLSAISAGLVGGIVTGAILAVFLNEAVSAMDDQAPMTSKAQIAQTEQNTNKAENTNYQEHKSKPLSPERR